MDRLRKTIPILNWIRDYSGPKLKGDLTAGLTVGVMLIPQGMAYAMLAGMPPIYGLYASLLPLLMYAILGTSPHLAVGPVATMALLVVAGVSPLAEAQSPTYIALAIALALMVGIFQIVLGLVRLGTIVHFLSRPVIKGYTSAAAIVISLSQMKHLLGIDLPRSSNLFATIQNLSELLSQTHLPTLLLGLLAMAILIGLRRVHKAIPGPLVVVVLGIAGVSWIGNDAYSWKVVGAVSAGLPGFALPEFDWADFMALLPTAATIAVVSFVESNAISRSLAGHQDAKQLRPNQELIALGVANAGGSFLGGFPVSGSFSRSALTKQAGGKTNMAIGFSAVLIGLTLLFLTALFHSLPLTILAAIIVAAVVRLVDYKEAMRLWRIDRVDFFLMLATFLATLLAGMVPGIIMGALFSLATVIYRSAYPHFAVLGRLAGSHLFRNRLRFPEVEEDPQVLVFRFDAQLYFANSDYFREQLEALVEEKGTSLKKVVLNAESMSFIDSTGVDMLRGMLYEMRVQGITLVVAGALGPVRDILFRTGLAGEIGRDNMFNDVEEALSESSSAPVAEQESPAWQTFVDDSK